MAKTPHPPPPAQTPTSTSTPQSPPKLPRLPKGTKIHKRPLLHPAIASARAGHTLPKVVYISARSPFVSSVKRVRAYLAAIEARGVASAAALGGRPKKKMMKGGGKGGKGGGEGEKWQGGKGDEEVLVRATGKAIDKALRVGLFFQGQEDCVVRLRTGSVGAVDDLEFGGNGGVDTDMHGDGDGDENGDREGEEKGDREGEELPESRVRRTSMLEVGISLR